MAISYPVGPTPVPAHLTQPPAAYRRRLWLALGGLVLFATLYVALTVWLGWTAYRLLTSAMQAGEDSFWAFVIGACAAALAVFMVKGLFFIKRGRLAEKELEITAAEQPELFAFLHRLADEARAPRPHRVFLSPRVNASVSYDLSLVNLIVPSKKNLEIGLGLVNVLTLGELKAVLAHEFGHFTQRSMAVGRWVYIAQQIAAQIVTRRDKFDALLNQLTRIDLRVAWIGWLLSIIVWSIRSLVDSFFSITLRMQRALSRAMEMHADLVAVSLTGSDSPIYALHHLRTADDAWDRTLAFAGSQLAKGHVVKDLFAIQSRLIERMGGLIDDEMYRSAPPLPTTNPESFRLFKAELAQPPRMWSTHPANDEREANAKREYISAPFDHRSGWLLFADAQVLRENMTALVVGTHEKATVLDADAAQRELDEQFNRESLDRRYRGIYLDRSVVRAAKRAAELYDTSSPSAIEQIPSLYPETLSRDLERLHTLEKEKALLDAVANGVMEASGGAVRHRGRQLRSRELPPVVAQLGEEIATLEKRLTAHDRSCRTAHRAAAARLGGRWEEYLCGLAAVLHYAEHAEANLADARRALANRVALATAGGRVGKSDVARVLDAARAMYEALSTVFRQKTQVVLDPTLLARLGAESWSAMLEEFKLGAPAEKNLGKWLGVVDGWASAALGPLGKLRRCALDQLLYAEARVARWVIEGSSPEPAPPAAQVPTEYPVLLPGSGRQLERKLHWWKRFQTADGVIPATARFLVAASIVGAVLAFGGRVGEATVTFYNGLGQPVIVGVGEQRLLVQPFSNASLALPPGSHRFRATTTRGEPIDSVDGTVSRGFGNYVYNVAGAGTLVEWTQTYGTAAKKPPRTIGALRWAETDATRLFTDPPTSISSSTEGGTVTVLSGFSAQSPSRVLAVLDDDRQGASVIAAHARWDSPRARYTISWIEAAKGLPNFRQLITERLATDPRDMLALRAEQDVATGAAHDSVCARARLAADSMPNDSDRQYLAARCIPDEPERDRAYLAMGEKFPTNTWFAFASGYVLAEDARWQEALNRFETVRASDSSMTATVADDIARLRRMIQGPHAGLLDIQDLSDDLHYHVALESGDEFQDSPYLAYADLGHGDLNKALRDAAAMTGLRERLLPFVAASDGADAALADSALDALPDSAITESNVWPLVALATRRHRDPAHYIEIAQKKTGRGVDRMARFAQILGAGGKPAQAEEQLGRVSPQGRGLAYSMGVVVLGPAAPAAWRDGAKRLLFASERPYFK